MSKRSSSKNIYRCTVKQTSVRINKQNLDCITQVKQTIGKTVSKSNPFAQVSNIDSKNRGLAHKNRSLPAFQYYISEVYRELSAVNRKEGEDEESKNIFINHVMYCLYTFKSHRYFSPPYEPHTNVNVNLEKMSKNKTILIFDLDQTLVHALSLYENFGAKDKNQDKYRQQYQITVIEKINPDEKQFSSSLKFEDNIRCGNENESFEKKIDSLTSAINKNSKKNSKIVKCPTKIKVNLRPFARQVLKRLSQNFILGIFTAGEEEYANQVLKILDPHSNLISFRLFRQHCALLSSQNSKRQYTKDLRIIQKIDLKRTILVDNSPMSYIYQPQNGIPIIPFTSQAGDDQLLKLQSFLHRYFRKCEDVRLILNKMFRSKDYEKFSTVKEVVEKVTKFNEFLL